MLEIPEARIISEQINNILAGKRIQEMIVGQTPHKFAWFSGDTQQYQDLLGGKTIGNAVSCGGFIEVKVDSAVLLFGDGAVLHYFAADEKAPGKHQWYLEFEDHSTLIGTVQMYGSFYAFPEGHFDNKYYQIAKAKPSPLSEAFDAHYFQGLLEQNSSSLPLKAFLATGQRIPGLGNGVLQDILFNAGLHPKKKVDTLSVTQKEDLFKSIKTTLREMVELAGRDTEKDLLGQPGRYITKLSKNTAGKPCLVCGTLIRKEAYLGGSIYYCSGCQNT